jgi:hypothetical protein
LEASRLVRRLVGEFTGGNIARDGPLVSSKNPHVSLLAGLTSPPPRPCPLSFFFYVKCSTAVMHARACMQSNGLQHRAVTPSPRAAEMQSINQSLSHARCNPSHSPVQYYVSEHSIKRLVSSRLACMRPHGRFQHCQRITAAVVEWRPVQHPLPPSPTAKK